MMKIALEFTYHTDVIAVPDSVGNQIKKCQIAFDKWLYNKENNHGHWICVNKKKAAVSFGTQTFVDYLNCFYLRDCNEKATIIDENCADVPKDTTTLFF